MGDVIPFKRPLGITPAFDEGGTESIGALAREIYHQCHVQAMAEAFRAKRKNPAMDLKRLVPSLTELFAQEVIADEVFRASVENNMQKLKLAEALQAVLESRHSPPQPRRAP